MIFTVVRPISVVYLVKANRDLLLAAQAQNVLIPFRKNS
jgi:hypothetical protein